MRRLFVPISASLLVLASCGAPDAHGNANAHEEAAGAGGSVTQGQVTITGAKVRLPAVAGRPGAAYFTIHNSGAPLTLTSASVARAERAELHESAMEGGMMRMRALSTLALPQGDTAFAPGGKHVMLFGLDPALKAGDTVPLTLVFDNGQSVTVEAQAQAMGGAAHGGH